MTKPKNFPERIRQRRLGALHRLAKSKVPPQGEDETGADFAKRRGVWMRRRDEETITLHERTVTNQRGVRTKKDRSAQAKFRRGDQ